MTNNDEVSADSSSKGLLWGMLSTAAYMLANLGLRGVVGSNANVGDLDWAIWVSANKAAPVVLAAWVLVGWRGMHGLPALPPLRMVGPLILTGLLMQWGGNVSFQFALSHVGLAMAVPLAFSTILVSSAVVGRIVLGDPLTSSTMTAIATMIAAVTVLTQGSRAATASLIDDSDLGTTLLAVGAACLAGIAYGSGGVMIRRCVRGHLSRSATIVVLSTTGLVTLGGVSLLRIGPAELWATPPDVWWKMLGAGIATAVAFFAISGAYQHLSVVKVNLLNASQAALAALAGVLLFDEPNTPWLHWGTLLTILGLFLSTRRDAPRNATQDAPANESLPPCSTPRPSASTK